MMVAATAMATAAVMAASMVAANGDSNGPFQQWQQWQLP
jgi:hypothetical protein